MNNSKRNIPRNIIRMIAVRRNRGLNAKAIATEINNSATARKSNLEYSHRTVAAVMANITMGAYATSLNIY